MSTFLVVAIVLAAILALIITLVLQRRGRQQALEVQIGNQGNVASAYVLRGESPEGTLAFRFRLDGRDLPELKTAAPAAAAAPAPESPGRAGTARRSVRRAEGAAGSLADVLAGIGMVLPGKLGSPLTSAASEMRQKQLAVQRVERIPDSVARVKNAVPGKGRAGADSSAAVPAPSSPGAGLPWLQPDPAPRLVAPDGQPGWVQTPRVQPMETLIVDLAVRALPGNRGAGPFRITSYCEDSATPPVVEEGNAAFARGFWAHPIWPYGTIIAAALVAVFLVMWLV